MSASLLNISESGIFTALRGALLTFGLTSFDPCDIFTIVQGQDNLVPEPKVKDYIVMWPIGRPRLAFNIDNVFDNQFTGSITSNILTVSALLFGTVTPGLSIYGPGIALGCQVGKQLTGTPGQTGTYVVTATPNVVSQTVYCGVKTALQKIDFTVQLDVHGPCSGDNAQRISTLFFDQFGVDALSDQNVAIGPLYVDDPRQIPFTNAEEQYEKRWVVDLHMEINLTATITQQFAGTVDVTTIDVTNSPVL